MHIYPNIEPIDPPIISKGKNIPPGAPEPKLIIENNNLPIKTKDKEDLLVSILKNITKLERKRFNAKF